MSLVLPPGDEIAPSPSGRGLRMTMMIRPQVRQRLRTLLMVDGDLRGVGYSDFLDQAIDAYEAQQWAFNRAGMTVE